jgi:hypothetical protein
MGEAFTVLRSFARNHTQRRSDVACPGVDGTVETQAMINQPNRLSTGGGPGVAGGLISSLHRVA